MTITLPKSTSTAISDTSEFPIIEGRVTADKVNSQFEIYFSELEDTKLLTQKLEKDTARRIEKMESSQARAIETIGIFAALLAFVAFEAQIFKGPLSTASLVGVSSIIFGSLTIFVLLLDLAFDAFKEHRNLRYGLFGLATACILLGFGFAKWGYLHEDHKEYLTRNQVEQIISGQAQYIENSFEEIESRLNNINSEDELLGFKNCILKQGLNRCL